MENGFLQYLNKKCNINIRREGKNLFFNAVVTNVTPVHLFFKDKFGDDYVFLISDVVEVRSI